jgi:hypothetical protein
VQLECREDRSVQAHAVIFRRSRDDAVGQRVLAELRVESCYFRHDRPTLPRLPDRRE